MSPSGRIVYMYAGGLRVYDIDADRDRDVSITIRSDRAETRLRFEDAAETLENYGLNSDGSRLVIASRGELWTVPVEGGRTVALTASSGVRERLPSFGPNDERIAAVTDETGEQEVAIFDAWGEQDREVLTREGKGWIFDPVWSPDGKWIAYADLTLTLRLVEVETGAVRVVHHADAWEIREYVFSPDGRYLAFTVPGSPFGESDMSIHIYDVRSGRSHAVTTPFSGDYSPSWSTDGRYLFFLSRRVINPVFCERDFEHATINSAVPCALVLKEGDVSPFASKEVLAMFEPEEDGKDGDEGEETESKDVPEVVIDFDGLRERVVQFPVDAGVYESLRAYPGGVFYLSREVEGILDQTWGGADAGPRFTLHQFDLKAGEDSVFVEPIRDYALSGDGEMVAFRMEKAIHVVSSAAPPEDPSDPESPGGVVDPSDLRLQVLPVAEWRQIFEETWRLQRDFYWAPDMAGVDWPAVREQYAPLLPRVGTRRELNDLIGEMIGELSTSHTYVWGGATRDADSIAVGMLGADLVPDVRTDRLRFAKVLRPEVWETHVHAPLAQPHTRVERGEYLISVNGRDVTGATNIHAVLANLADAEVMIEVGREADGSDAREIQVETIGMDRDLRYLDWRRRNREYVDKASQGRIGYLHLPDMDAGGLVAFATAFYAQLDREGLVIDIRYNGGGFISSMLIERLARELWAYDVSRWGGTTTYPNRTHTGHKVVLINYFAGSDGDIFPESFRLRGLGPLIGTRTWGGVNGIRADKAYIDGGMVTQPEFAWWEPKRGWGLENGGVAPDIEVDILPADSAVDHDAQLERAIAELMRTLAEDPVRLPEPPPYPDKSIDAMRSGNWE
jgi:tricorn protease